MGKELGRREVLLRAVPDQLEAPRAPMTTLKTRTLALVLGDQLSHTSPALRGLVPDRDAVLMVEAPGEATHVWSHKARIVLFLSAMRHFRDELRERGLTVHYIALDDSACVDLPGRLRDQLQALRPQTLSHARSRRVALAAGYRCGGH